MLASSRGKRKGRKCPRGFFAGCRIPARPVVAPKDGAGLAVLLRVDLAMTMANGISLSLSLSLSFFRYISAEQCHIPKLLPHHTYRDTQHHPYRGTRHLRYVQEHRSTRAHEDERARTASHRERERAQGLQRPREGGGGGGGGGHESPPQADVVTSRTLFLYPLGPLSWELSPPHLPAQTWAPAET